MCYGGTISNGAAQEANRRAQYRQWPGVLLVILLPRGFLTPPPSHASTPYLLAPRAQHISSYDYYKVRSGLYARWPGRVAGRHAVNTGLTYYLVSSQI